MHCTSLDKIVAFLIGGGGHTVGGGDNHLYLESCIYVGLSALVFGVFEIIALWKKRIVKILAIISLLFSILILLVFYK
jgi:hypothetical protein